MSEFIITGQAELLKDLDDGFLRLKSANKSLMSIASQSRSRLISNTPTDTSRTVKKWSSLKKINDLCFEVENTMESQDGKHAIADIINYGRKEVKPINAKKLYIPLSMRAKFKKLGAPIPKGYKYGVDYVLAKKSKAVKGTKFINKEIAIAQKNIDKLVGELL